MHNTLKVAKWEIKRNLKNKSFIIGLFLTPALFLFFALLPSLFGDSDDKPVVTQVYINDQLDIYGDLQATVDEHALNWDVHTTDISETEAANALDGQEDTAYIFVDHHALDDSMVPVYTSEEIDSFFTHDIQLLEEPLRAMQMKVAGLSDEQLALVNQGVTFDERIVDESTATEANNKSGESGLDPMERVVPAAFAGIILLSIVFTGMMVFQSASQEKKDKIAEIILSSLTPGELMQGKIIGYFILGIIQVVVFLVFIIPLAIWKTDIPIMEYLLVPELLLLVGLAILGYLLFASIFVALGATMADISTSGNFQGMVLMLPFLPFVFIGPVLNDPSGLFAQIGTYIPFTSSGVLMMRLAMLEDWPWIEIAIAYAILIISTWLFMKLAGKIFKVGILMYGKNATPKEIWKWIRA
ncbi:ABC-2 type transport system permease protein [Virgibacillus halotolerans]|uniref:ABC transporter permease n=1 Tax=Virgibacillus halotolerans TaxID=1071053 RepID=UPI00196026B0|nr:ABC transporter permease [Virgibacillus halotolerans]MBM7600786.1 ABC-2 type transport system permease protein [Virgibacillus halotolerans]